MCDTGFGWQKQKWELLRWWAWWLPRSAGEGTGREEPRGLRRAVTPKDLGSFSSFLKKRKNPFLGFFFLSQWRFLSKALVRKLILHGRAVLQSVQS